MHTQSIDTVVQNIDPITINYDRKITLKDGKKYVKYIYANQDDFFEVSGDKHNLYYICARFNDKPAEIKTLLKANIIKDELIIKTTFDLSNVAIASTYTSIDEVVDSKIRKEYELTQSFNKSKNPDWALGFAMSIGMPTLFCFLIGSQEHKKEAYNFGLNLLEVLGVIELGILYNYQIAKRKLVEYQKFISLS